MIYVLDLCMETTTKQGWINIYSNTNLRFPRKGDQFIWDSKEEAKNNIMPDYIATTRIEWEE